MKRFPGLAVMVAVVVVGMGMPTAYRWMVGDLNRRRERILAEAPTEPEARIGLYFEYGQPRILEALHGTRFSARQPWLVSHVVAPRSGEEPPEVWGVPDEEVVADCVRLDGMVVRVVLPAPRVVARDVLVGDNALGVRVYPPHAPPEDPRVLLANRLGFVLEPVYTALEGEIEGASMTVEVGGLVTRPGVDGGGTRD